MTIHEEAIEVLVQKAAGIFGKKPDELGADTRFIEDLMAKSVNFVQLSAALEEKFEVEVPYMEFRKKKTFGEAAAYIASMLGE